MILKILVCMYVCVLVSKTRVSECIYCTKRLLHMILLQNIVISGYRKKDDCAEADDDC